MRGRGWRLRSILTLTTLVIVSLALLVSAVLMLLASILHRTTSSATASVESVRLTEEAVAEVLLHGRALDRLVKRDLEESIKRRLSSTRRFVTSEQEGRVLAEAEARVADYIATARDPQAAGLDLAARQEAAYVALEALVDLKVAQARHANADAALWNRRAEYLGAAVAALLILGAFAALLWLKHRAFAPVFSLSEAMRRFGGGDPEARARESGPAELREMSRRFNEMAAALAAQRQAQIAFLGGVAHDLRNPLSVLKLSLALVPSDRPLPPEPRLRQLFEKAARQIARLDRMASDFLDLSKLEAGQLELKLDVHDARGLVRGVLELFEGTSPEPQFLVSLPDESVGVSCDQLRVEQVLANLIGNAIKYSPAGSTIEVGLESSPQEVVFRVTDHGIGIPESERERVFEPFRRVGLSREDVPGVGLGLFMVRRIVEAHGGSVEVESRLGIGSTFRVRLPRADGARAPKGVLRPDLSREAPMPPLPRR